MSYTYVAHDCRVGRNVIFANNATLAGHITIGDHASIGGLSAIHQFVHIGDYAFIGGMAAVVKRKSRPLCSSFPYMSSIPGSKRIVY